MFIKKYTFSQSFVDLKKTITAINNNVHFLHLQDISISDLERFTSVSMLEVCGLESLKAALVDRGLKCGGSLRERAERLFSVRGLSRDDFDPSLFASKGKGKGKNT